MPIEMSELSDEAMSLSRIPMFRQLDADELAKLADEMDRVEVKAGEVIFREHDRGDALYIVESGSVRIWVHDEDLEQVVLSERGPDEFFGELAVLDQGERSANATAAEESVLHRLLAADLEAFLLRHPETAVDMIREVGARLRQTNVLIAQRISRNVNQTMEENLTTGQRIADKVAAFGGSWTFIFIFSGAMLVWIAINTFLLSRYGLSEANKDGIQFDPYPYILLNLVLSMTAAMQAPVIMMSQNRSSEKDRLAAENDFKVNLKSELMLEELILKDREHAERLNELTNLTRELHGRSNEHGRQIT
jgi:CRP/FNR family cyclic AMP-dependent transcriptional regulator